MPIYTYRAKDVSTACDQCRESFEIMQKISESAMDVCPTCGKPIVRILHPASNVRLENTKKLLSDENLKKHGFKKLVNTGGGKYDEVV